MCPRAGLHLDYLRIESCVQLQRSTRSIQMLQHTGGDFMKSCLHYACEHATSGPVFTDMRHIFLERRMSVYLAEMLRLRKVNNTVLLLSIPIPQVSGIGRYLRYRNSDTEFRYFCDIGSRLVETEAFLNMMTAAIPRSGQVNPMTGQRMLLAMLH
ncbi:unnamed protein product [Ranitomeya imitator]|uniref:Uncharacterized protein n=1 Tax=Ranitomeya imitator TaxID=111125 RepID=A0ABN9LST3_9NEOB|nr:unnamed protein product [Ranitomeya imitator]